MHGSYSNVKGLKVQYRTIDIKFNKFEQNYAGQRASVINLHNIQNSIIDVKSNQFRNNTEINSVLEKEHKLPFYDILTMRQFKLNYFQKRRH